MAPAMSPDVFYSGFAMSLNLIIAGTKIDMFDTIIEFSDMQIEMYDTQFEIADTQM